MWKICYTGAHIKTKSCKLCIFDPYSFRVICPWNLPSFFETWFLTRWNFSLVARYFFLVGRYFCSLLFARCLLFFACYFLLVARYFLLVARYFLLVARYFLLVARQEILNDFFLIKINKKFSILICTKSLICE